MILGRMSIPAGPATKESRMQMRQPPSACRSIGLMLPMVVLSASSLVCTLESLVYRTIKRDPPVMILPRASLIFCDVFMFSRVLIPVLKLISVLFRQQTSSLPCTQIWLITLLIIEQILWVYVGSLPWFEEECRCLFK